MYENIWLPSRKYDKDPLLKTYEGRCLCSHEEDASEATSIQCSNSACNRYHCYWCVMDYHEIYDVRELEMKWVCDDCLLNQWKALMYSIRHFTQKKNLRQELVEKLYHPDRYERMVATYGEVWADIHIP